MWCTITLWGQNGLIFSMSLNINILKLFLKGWSDSKNSQNYFLKITNKSESYRLS